MTNQTAHDIDLEALYGFKDNIDFSYGDPTIGDKKEQSVDYTSDGEYDFRIQQPLGEGFIINVEMADDKENEARKGGDAENRMSDNINKEDGVQQDNSDGGYSFYIKQRLTEDIENRKLELYKAAIIGDWKKAKEIFFNNLDHISPTTRLNTLGETALHIATAANQIEFIANLVDSMDEEDLRIKTYGRRKSEEITPSTRINEVAEKDVEKETRYESVEQTRDDRGEGNTALCYAAVSGNIRSAIYMLEKVPDLSMIRGEEDILPIRMAAWHGNHNMVFYLYDQYLKHHNLDENDGIEVLMAFIDCDIYDIAIQMVLEKPWLAAKANSKGLTALHAFARKSRITSNNFSNKTSFVNKYFSKRQENLRRQGLDLVKLLLELAMSAIEERSSKLIKNALFEAAERGNYEFLTTALDLNPDLAFELDENYYTIFHIALLHRHVDIFNLVHEMDSIQNIIRLTKDKEGNNILHLAAKLPLSGLQVVPGEALQLQRELYWFQKVKRLVGKHLTEARNDKGKTPRELFAEEHEDLRKGGAKWMKATINSCMVVATLVAGVAFASAVTVPGGIGNDNGIPVLINHVWFKVFAILNALSLIFSASSILLFLTIFTSHYSLGDFLKSLPTKFTLGLLSLSAAVQAMVVAFVAAFFIMFKHRKIGFAYPIAAIALIPVVFFVIQHFRLLLLYICLLLSFQTQPKTSPFSTIERLTNWCRLRIVKIFLKSFA